MAGHAHSLLQRARQVLRVVKRGIEQCDVKRRVRKRYVLERSCHAAEEIGLFRQKLRSGAKSVNMVIAHVERHTPVTHPRKAMAEPSIDCAEIEDIAGLARRHDHAMNESLERTRT